MGPDFKKDASEIPKPTLEDRIQQARIKLNLDQMKTGIDRDQQEQNWVEWKENGIEPKTQIQSRGRSNLSKER